jgi:p21-activated kinase 1
MEETKSRSRLTKKPPPGSFAAANLSSDARGTDSRLSLRSQRSAGSLQRNPSAPYPRSQNPYSHSRKITSPNPATYTSSNSSLDRQISGPSPVLQSPEFTAATSSGQGGASNYNNHNSNSTRPLSEKTSQEFVGAPFDGSSILNHIDSTKASGYQNSLRRPPPPPLSHTSPLPQLRQSASFSAGDRTMSEKAPPRVGENQIISPKRYSDETKDPKAGMIRKKSGFSGFMSSIGVGSPRGVKISAPENPVHVTHVGYDNTTGQFTVSSAA